jgi:endonuclease/exonuclease/phosphatase family metal-dependent hydrolase
MVQSLGYRDTWLTGNVNNLTAHPEDPTYRIDYIFVHDGYAPAASPSSVSSSACVETKRDTSTPSIASPSLTDATISPASLVDNTDTKRILTNVPTPIVPSTTPATTPPSVEVVAKTTSTTLPTSKSDSSSHRSDYRDGWYSNGRWWTVSSAYVDFAAASASDHYPVVVTLLPIT